MKRKSIQKYNVLNQNYRKDKRQILKWFIFESKNRLYIVKKNKPRTSLLESTIIII